MNNKIERKNFIWNFLGLTANSFTSFFFLIIANRINGGKEAGVFTFSYSLICLFFFIGAYYNRTYQVSDNSKKYTNKEYIYNRLVSCLFMILLTLLYVYFSRYNSFKSSIIIFLCLYRLFEAFSESLFGILQKENYLYKAGISQFFKGVIGIFIFLIIDLLTHSLLFSTSCLILVNLLFLIIYDYPNTKKYIEKDGNFLKSFSLFKKTFPIFVFSILNVFLINVSKYTLDYYETAEIQNVFGILLMPGTVLSLCCQYLLNPYILKLSDLYKERKIKTFNLLLFKISVIILVLGIVGEILCLTIGIPILNIIYKVNLLPYKMHLAIIILGSIFLALTSILSSALTIIKRNMCQMYIFIFDSIIALILSIILVKNYLILGACLTYLITMILQFLNSLIAFRKYENK